MFGREKPQVQQEGNIFKTGSQIPTKDCAFVCELLAIDPSHLIERKYEDFAEKGLSQKRQLLRFEHYDERRKLKLQAIERILYQSYKKDQASAEFSIGFIANEVKRSRSNLKPQDSVFHAKRRTQASVKLSPIRPEPTRKQEGAQKSSQKGSIEPLHESPQMLQRTSIGYDSQKSIEDLNRSLFTSFGVNQLEPLIAQQVDRVQRKLNHWDIMAQSVWDKKQENNTRRKELAQTVNMKVDKAQLLHKNKVTSLVKQMGEKHMMWSTRRENHHSTQRKDENERLRITRQFTYKFGDKLIEERQQKDKQLAQQDSQIYLERFNSRLSFEANKKEREDHAFHESQAKLNAKMEIVEENVQRRNESIETRREMFKAKQSFDLEAYYKTQEEIRDKKFDKTYKNHHKKEQYKQQQADKLKKDIDQLREGRSQKFLMVKNLQQDKEQMQRAHFRQKLQNIRETIEKAEQQRKERFEVIQELAEINRLRQAEALDSTKRDQSMRQLRNMKIITKHQRKAMLLEDLQRQTMPYNSRFNSLQ